MTRLKKLSLVSLALVCASAALVARTPQQSSPSWTETTAQLDKAVLAEDAAGLKAARIACLRVVAAPAAGVRAPLARYAVAYVDWRLAFNSSVSDAEQSGALDEAVAQLQQAIKLDPKFAEASALLSGVEGGKIAKNPDLGMTLGMESTMLIQSANAQEPNNPRILLLHGDDAFHTPPEYGGSKQEAEALFRRALDEYDKEALSKPWPTWGRFDAHAWLGQALADRKDTAGARAEFNKALSIAPNSQWVKYVLLPQLGKGTE